MLVGGKLGLILLIVCVVGCVVMRFSVLGGLLHERKPFIMPLNMPVMPQVIALVLTPHTQ